MTLQWSPESIHDLIALRVHIAEHDPAAAKRVALHILYCIEYLLPENPSSAPQAASPARANSSFPMPIDGKIVLRPPKADTKSPEVQGAQ